MSGFYNGVCVCSEITYIVPLFAINKFFSMFGSFLHAYPQGIMPVFIIPFFSLSKC